MVHDHALIFIVVAINELTGAKRGARALRLFLWRLGVDRLK
jgi:hypothetical protein